MYDAFYPGQVWLDTNGNRIQAHGGSLIYLDGVYYWYGENKEKRTRLRASGTGAFVITHLQICITGRIEVCSSRP